jgi:DNA-binding CsgD family transcriptional regulator
MQRVTSQGAPPATGLLERERELHAIAGALALGERAEGGFLLIEAPAGMGKTSLLNAATESAAAAGFTCLRARASELERGFAYGCVRQLLEPVVANDSDGLFDGAAVLSRPLFDVTDDAATDGFALLHGLYWLLNNLAADRPVALMVDDLHWSDPASLQFLAYLAPRLDGMALAVIGATRPREGDAALLARLATAPEVEVVRPAALTTTATVALCEHELEAEPAPDFAAACHAATAGNPFFLEALLREVHDRNIPPVAGEAGDIREIGPASVAQAVLLRLSGAPSEATGLVRAVAVLGDAGSLREAAALTGLAEEEVMRAADVLAGLGILTLADGLGFTHPIVRQAVYADLGPAERGAAHARAADVLVDTGAAVERIAAQLQEATPAGDAERVALLRQAAHGALARGAPDAAAAWLSRALAEPPPSDVLGELLAELGSAQLRLGSAEAVEHLSSAADELSDPALRAHALRDLANALTVSGQADRSISAFETAIEVLAPVDREGALELEAELMAHSQWASVETRGPVAKRLDRFADLAGDSRGERLVLASLAAERGRLCDSAADAIAIYERALAGGRLLAEQNLDNAGPIYHLVIGLLECDAYEPVGECLDQMLEIARSRGAVPTVAYATAWCSILNLRRGAVAVAAEDARTALDLLTEYGIELGRGNARALLANALLECGDLDGALRAFRDIDAPVVLGVTRNFLLRVRSMLHFAHGRPQAGIDDLRAFVEHDESQGGANPYSFRWRSEVALGLAALGDRDGARALAAEDLEIARRWGSAPGIGIATRAVALVSEGEGRIDGLRDAVAVLAPSGAELEHARALLDYGAALRRANRRSDARPALDQALAIAERVGALGVAATARVELGAAGGRVDDPHGGELTVSERRVAELAAEGRSNPEIAQALFVTRKTVETHLGHVYRKLDISGRGELAEAL